MIPTVADQIMSCGVCLHNGSLQQYKGDEPAIYKVEGGGGKPVVVRHEVYSFVEVR